MTLVVDCWIYLVDVILVFVVTDRLLKVVVSAKLRRRVVTVLAWTAALPVAAQPTPPPLPKPDPEEDVKGRAVAALVFMDVLAGAVSSIRFNSSRSLCNDITKEYNQQRKKVK